MQQFLAAFAVGLILVSVPAGTAPQGNGSQRCATAFKFGPGPVVNGQHRQPTAAEVDQRMQELQAQGKFNAGACWDAPLNRQDALLRSRLNPVLGTSVLMIAELP